MSDPIRDTELYRKDIEKIIEEGWDKIAEGVGYIDRHEDSPLTMREVMKEFGDILIRIENEVFTLVMGYNEVEVTARLLRKQRREALKARNALKRLLRQYREADFWDGY